jgi:hypothetical protein
MSGSEFWDRGYVVAHDFLDPSQLTFVRTAMETSHRTGRMQLATTAKILPQGAMNEYAPIAGEAMQVQRCPAIEAIVERKLVPAYALWRIYREGDELRRHTDRNSCEISASVAIHGDPNDQSWPIFVKDLHGTETGVELNPGDAIIYQGCRVPHWREPLVGTAQYQLFLHYVIAEGDHAELAYDGRAGLRIGGA